MFQRRFILLYKSQVILEGQVSFIFHQKYSWNPFTLKIKTISMETFRNWKAARAISNYCVDSNCKGNKSRRSFNDFELIIMEINILLE